MVVLTCVYSAFSFLINTLFILRANERQTLHAKDVSLPTKLGCMAFFFVCEGALLYWSIFPVQNVELRLERVPPH